MLCSILFLLFLAKLLIRRKKKLEESQINDISIFSLRKPWLKFNSVSRITCFHLVFFLDLHTLKPIMTFIRYAILDMLSNFQNLCFPLNN